MAKKSRGSIKQDQKLKRKLKEAYTSKFKGLKKFYRVLKRNVLVQIEQMLITYLIY